MSKSSKRSAARKARQQRRHDFIEQNIKDIKAKFPKAIAAWITFGGNPASGNSLESRMKEEAAGGLGFGRRQLRRLVKDRKESEARHIRRMKLEKERKAFAAHQENKQKTSVIRRMFRKGVA